MDDKNKLQKFDLEALPSFFKDLTGEQQTNYLEKLAGDNADLKQYIGKKISDSKIAERDMVTDIEFLKQIETENKVINIKREYQTGSGKMELSIKGGDKKFIIPILVILGIVIIAIAIIFFGK
ncbi:hypothetical protein FBD94_20285 [Pedobacter hiemivivus]|uniref:Uncharacterized protein n=1 Tax=Pedobacter hiemivivus TaxID=2530454 RepID=A0A4U1G2B3_9SPHI|nr:hypothetical protein [Pedobacter hiemivivus]TKC57618.1 hypothetical protein FBD94_20285 [Pedobacter hiemivivus]